MAMMMVAAGAAMGTVGCGRRMLGWRWVRIGGVVVPLGLWGARTAMVVRVSRVVDVDDDAFADDVDWAAAFDWVGSIEGARRTSLYN
jgi:hypothetical protein